MMEWGDRGLKDGEDVLAALMESKTGPNEGGPAYEMHKIMEPIHGRRITGLMADALDLAIGMVKEAAVQRHAAERVSVSKDTAHLMKSVLDTMVSKSRADRQPIPREVIAATNDLRDVLDGVCTERTSR